MTETERETKEVIRDGRGGDGPVEVPMRNDFVFVSVACE
jgi:hypothetical protein